MKKTPFVMVFITTSSLDEANKIADVLLTEKKIACVNIVPKVFSFYWWQGKREKAKEALLIIKTKENFLDTIINRVKELHSYTVPEIIALPIIGGNRDYLNWVNESVENEE